MVFITIWQQLGHTISRGMYISIVVTGFLIGACFLAWRDQYRARLKAEKSHYDGRPQLMLSTTDQKAQIWLKGQLAFVFSLQNCGQRAARFITIDPIPSLSERYSLHILPNQPEALMPGSRPPAMYEVWEKGDSGGPYAKQMANSPDMLIEFFKDNEAKKTATYPVTIRYTDADNSEGSDRMSLECEWPTIRLRVRPPN